MERPAYLAPRTTRLAEQAVAGLGGASPPSLSIADNKFTLIDGAGNEKNASAFDQATGELYCDVVIADINANVSKIYYKEKYDPSAKEYKPPTCFSDNGVAPSQQAAEPQCLTCAACPHNAWGSKISEQSGKQVKSCNDLKKMAIIIPGIQMPFLMRVPPATLKNFKSYAQTVASHGADLCEVTTRIKFESQGVLKFAPVGWIAPETAQQLAVLEASKATDALVGRNDIPNTRPIGGQQLQAPPQAAPALAPPPQMMAPAAPVAAPQAPAPMFMQAAQAAPAPAFQPPPAPPPNVPMGVQPANSFGSPPVADTPPAPARRTRRTKEQIAADEAAKAAQAPFPAATTAAQQAPPAATMAAANADDGIPPFLRRAAPAPAAPAQPSFGMQQPAAPTSDIEAQLQQAFNLPTT